MKLHIMGKKPLCLLYAAAMVLDMEPQDLADETGVTGLEETFPDEFGQNKLRSHHMQEVIWSAFKRKIAMVPFYRSAVLQVPTGTVVIDGLDQMKASLDTGHRAILITETHAYAWDGKQVFDPRGPITEIHPGLIEKIQVVWLACDLIK